MRKLFILLFSFTFFFLSFSPIEAKSSSPTVSLSRSRNRLSLYTTYSRLSKVRSITYSLTYDSTKGKQGVASTIKVPSGRKEIFRSILLGTCSHNVCTYHNGVKNIRLSVDFNLKSGGVISYDKTLK